MKKRILALALAGTTAFSVFGAAISANAAIQTNYFPSTDTKYNVDAYESYVPVAQKISVTKDATSDHVLVDKYKGVTVKIFASATNDLTKLEFKSVDDYIAAQYGEKRTVYSVAPTSADDALNYLGNCEKIELIRVYNNSANYIRWANATQIDSWKGSGFTVEPLKGSYYVHKDQYATATSDNYNGCLGDNTTIYYDADVVGNEADFFNQVSDMGNAEPAESNYVAYKVNPQTDSVNLTVANDKFVGAEADIEKALNVLSVEIIANGGYTYNGSYYADATKLVEAFKVEPADVQFVKGGVVTSWNNDLVNNLVDQQNTILVDDYDHPNVDYSYWTFNSDMTGEATVTPFEVTTSIEDGSLKVEKDPTYTIYAYDFIPWNTTKSSASNIASVWNKGDTTSTATALIPYNYSDNTYTMTAEKGAGNPSYGIRYDIVSDWEDFLEELAISDGFFYSESFDEFCDNYKDMFYSDAIYNHFGEQIGTVDVDLYNIEGLLRDIWNLHEKADYYQANTSELVYLMQQYDKYIGDYIGKTEVASDEWGDLLLSILDAATEEDFRSASEYRKYQNKVEDLRDAYELATTTNMIKVAETEMYALLTSGNSPYRASATPDKEALNDTLEGLYFNVGTAPTIYSVAPSTQNNNVDYSNYNYLVAAVTGGSDTWGNNLYFGSKLSKGYYSLYPMNDYLDYTGATNAVYAGNKTEATYAAAQATDEYEWFWNVYQLAANMKADNTKQGSVDAVNDALADAVAELSVTTTPAAMDTGAMNDAVEEYTGKIESDYDAGYYAKYVQANDYAENIAEGKWQTRIAAMITGVAGEALTYQGTQVTITKNDMKTVETAIKNGETALKAIKEDPDYNAAQVTALNKAIATAEDLVSLYEGTYSTKKDDQSVNKNYSRLVGDKDQMVKSDLTAAIEAIDAAINYSEIVMGWSKNDAGKWMYGTEEGYLSNGWNKIGKTWFYFNADGTAKQSEWFQENGTWYWFNSNCGAATGWAKVDGEWYFFKGNNAMKTGWEKVDGNWYYMASSGKMVTGWCEVNGKWYYFSKASNSLGQMLYSTTVDGYKLGADGAWIK